MSNELKDNDIKDGLQRQPFYYTGRGIAMFLPLENYILPAAEQTLEITEMYDNLYNWSIPLMHGFNLSPKLVDIYIPIKQPMHEIKERHYPYSGFYKGELVCSMSLSLYNNMARLNNVATMPSHRGQGYATQLIYYALKKAQQQNIWYCFLEASQLGLSLYEKIGFERFYVPCYYDKDPK